MQTEEPIVTFRVETASQAARRRRRRVLVVVAALLAANVVPRVDCDVRMAGHVAAKVAHHGPR